MLRGRLIAILAVLCCTVVVMPASADARAFGSRVLKVGSRGNDVKTLQQHLTKVGFAATADGIFGRGTERSVRSWETTTDIAVNGKVSKRDAKLLTKAVAAIAEQEAAPDAVEAPDKQEAAQLQSTTAPNPGGAGYVKVSKATINPDGTATPPANAPEAVKAVIEAGNAIAFKPYKYGGGHGKWEDSGYDCSGSVSYALHGGGLLDQSMPSGSFESWGESGPGTWITLYANGGHIYMVVAGLRFDTSAAKAQSNRSRWTTQMRSSDGFVVRHPVGY